ncbi:MAG: hypothetical protein M1835_006069 [Candelina submexicana]|nr:MAG: hypothetical protein M1835_006069 [Candelina submexicana]
MATSQTPIDPSMWTIRFKHQKATILLFVDPLASLDIAKEDLLTTLNEIYSGGHFNGLPIPTHYSGIAFGVPIDRQDPSKGWVDLEIPETEVKAGAAGKKKVGGKGSVLNSSFKGAGLKDGAMVAFRFVTKGKDLDAEAMDEDEVDGQGHGYDVVIPSYDDDTLVEQSEKSRGQ